jgi:WD40 repeat protein
VSDVRFLHDQRTLASTSEDGTVKLWDTSTWAERLSVYVEREEDAALLLPPFAENASPHLCDVHAVGFADGDKKLLARSEASVIRIWDIPSGRLLSILNDQGEKLESAYFSADGTRALLVHRSGPNELWDTVNGRKLSDVATGDIQQIEFTPDSQTFAIADSEHGVSIWDSFTGTQWEYFAKPSSASALNSLRFSSSGDQLIATYDDGSAVSWNAQTGDVFQPIRGGATSVAFAPDGQSLAVGNDRGQVAIHRFSDGHTLHRFEAHASRVRALAFAPSGQLLASTGNDGICNLWDVDTRQRIHSFDDSTGAALADVRFSADNQSLAATTHGMTLIWSINAREIRWRLPSSWCVFSTDFSRDGQTVACASADDTIELWRLPQGATESTQPSGKPIPLDGHANGVLCVRFSPQQDLLASAGGDNRICLWNTQNNELLRTLEGHSDWVRSVAFSNDGRHLVSVGDDQTMRLWSVDSGKQLAIVTAHSDRIWCVAKHPTENVFATAGSDGVTRLWNVDMTENSPGIVLRYEVSAASKDPTAPAAVETLVTNADAPRLDVEEQALKLVTSLGAELILLSDIVDRLRTASGIDPAVRQRAIVLAKRRKIDTQALNNAAWSIVLPATATLTDCQRALRMMQAACAASPNDGTLLNTLGMAQFRCKMFKEAAETLMRAHEQNRSRRPLPHDLAFLAMCFQHLGEPEKAKEYLSQGRKAANQSHWSGDDEVKAIMAEAEKTVLGQAALQQ